MGIKNFNKLLKDFAPNSLKEKKITDYKNKKIAIDTSLILYKYITALRKSGKDLEDNDGNSTSHIFAILQNVIYFLDKDIIPVYVFDGKAPEIKKNTLEKRKKIKKEADEKKKNSIDKEEQIKYFQRSLFISKNQYEECKKILSLIGIEYIQALGEADCICSQLVKEKYVYAAYSNDMDFLTFGCPILLKKEKDNKIIELNLSNVLEELDINYDSFINLCILLGTDYLPTIKGIGYKTAYKMIKIDKNINEILKKKNKITIPKNYDFENIIKYYKMCDKILFNKNDNISILDLKNFLKEKNFSEKIIKKYIDKFNKYHSQ